MAQKTIAFYSPLKPADHPVPSGDRLMARLLIACLQQAGYRVVVASQLRAFLRDPDDEADKHALMDHAHQEVQRLISHWATSQAPDLWFCYHPYYKSPDLIGPVLCETFGIPYVTAEASFSARRNHGVWAQMQQQVLNSVNCAAVNICFTQRDKAGLRQASPTATLSYLPPFIDISNYSGHPSRPEPCHLVTVAMMRAGDKLNSYARLAASLAKLNNLPWTLSVVGDGPLQDDVRALFASFPEDRIVWHGMLAQVEIAVLLARSALYVWPGCGEAYGLSYLEAQASGVPVVAYDTAGVPEVVVDGVSGRLTASGDDDAYAAAIQQLLVDKEERERLSVSAASHVQRVHAAEQASRSLSRIIEPHIAL